MRRFCENEVAVCLGELGEAHQGRGPIHLGKRAKQEHHRGVIQQEGPVLGRPNQRDVDGGLFSWKLETTSSHELPCSVAEVLLDWSSPECDGGLGAGVLEATDEDLLDVVRGTKPCEVGEAEADGGLRCRGHGEDCTWGADRLTGT